MRFVDPFDLVFLRPALRVSHIALQLVRVSVEALLHSLVNIDVVARPVVARGRCQVVKFVAFSCRSGDDA